MGLFSDRSTTVIPDKQPEGASRPVLSVKGAGTFDDGYWKQVVAGTDDAGQPQ